jgi:hypothetical protein
MQSKQIKRKKYYHFTIYKLKFYYEKDVQINYHSSIIANGFITKSWVNHSCYEKYYSKKFTSYQKYIKFLKKENYYSINGFYCDLNKAIKDNQYNIKQYIITVYCSE